LVLEEDRVLVYAGEIGKAGTWAVGEGPPEIEARIPADAPAALVAVVAVAGV
jgi:hypothetical protein